MNVQFVLEASLACQLLRMSYVRKFIISPCQERVCLPGKGLFPRPMVERQHLTEPQLT